MEYRFDPGALALDDVGRLAADMWSGIAFDESALARLRRDGLTLDGVRLTGPSPFEIGPADDGRVVVSNTDAVSDPTHIETLLDLWRIHMMKGLRPGSLTAETSATNRRARAFLGDAQLSSPSNQRAYRGSGRAWHRGR